MTKSFFRERDSFDSSNFFQKHLGEFTNVKQLVRQCIDACVNKLLMK
jgi:hypothetical protein